VLRTLGRLKFNFPVAIKSNYSLNARQHSEAMQKKVSSSRRVRLARSATQETAEGGPALAMAP
jgi:hypothetical protein